MRSALIRVDEIPQNEAVTVDLFGREVLVMLLNGKPRAYANVCMHHGGPLTLDGDTFTDHHDLVASTSQRATSQPEIWDLTTTSNRVGPIMSPSSRTASADWRSRAAPNVPPP